GVGESVSQSPNDIVAFAQPEGVLQRQIDGVHRGLGQRIVPERVIYERLDFVTRAVRDELRPASQRVEAVEVTGAVGQIAGVSVSLPREVAVVARVMIKAKTAFPEVPTVVGRLAVSQPEIVIHLISAVNPVVGVLADLSAVTRASQCQMHITAAAVKQPALG